jgi:hypothetical protein
MYIITNALANASADSNGALNSTNVPANAYIAFDPVDSDEGPEVGVGYFYVTNKSGFFLPLSGLDANDNYYSYIELDSQNQLYQNQGFELGFVNTEVNNAPFEGVASYNVNGSGTGTENDHSSALLYIHDDPYAYDAADSPSIFQSNYLLQGGGDDTTANPANSNANAIEIWGALKATIKMQAGNTTSQTYSFSGGSGNMIYQKLAFPYGNVIQSATATLNK